MVNDTGDTSKLTDTSYDARLDIIVDEVVISTEDLTITPVPVITLAEPSSNVVFSFPEGHQICC